jgi:hypothetical protein
MRIFGRACWRLADHDLVVWALDPKKRIARITPRYQK